MSYVNNNLTSRAVTEAMKMICSKTDGGQQLTANNLQRSISTQETSSSPEHGTTAVFFVRLVNIKIPEEYLTPHYQLLPRMVTAIDSYTPF